MEFPAPTAPFVVAMLMGTIKKPKLTNVTTGMFTGWAVEKRIRYLGQFEKRIAQDIADLDEDDELNFDDDIN